jgi:hypothetical protein
MRKGVKLMCPDSLSSCRTRPRRTTFPEPGSACRLLRRSPSTTTTAVSTRLLPARFTQLILRNADSCFYRAIHGRKLLSLFPSELPLTTSNITRALENAPKTDGFYVVPYVLKLLGESDQGVGLLKGFKIVTYGGAACPDELGDRLVREGVRLVGHYGMTEV